MTRTLLMLFAAALMLPAYAQQSANLEELAKMVHEGKIDVGKDYSMDHKKGRFHVIHLDVLGMDCGTCHYGSEYQPDYLLVRKQERLRANGQMDWSSCLGCHQTGGTATPWYIGRAGVK